MKQSITLALAVILATSCTETFTGERQNFNDGWKFAVCSGTALLETPVTVFDDGALPAGGPTLEVPYGCHLPEPADGESLLARSVGPEDSDKLCAPDFDDSSWRGLSLPHDWAVEGDFNRLNPSGTGGGALPGGIGWYRKHFRMDGKQRGKAVHIDFDGVYMNSTVWINGVELGTRPYGYISFSYDLTPHINWDGDNVIAVRVNNSDQPNSRWYSGCGIYRNVWLRIQNPAHIAQWGVFARNEGDSLIRVTTEAEVPEGFPVGTAEILAELFDAEGRKVSSSRSPLERPDGTAEGRGICEQTLPVEEAELWSTDNPYLYKLRICLLDKGKPCDVQEIATGIRTFEFDAETGFYLNGKPMKISGVCLHHDLGALGAAFNVSASERQLRIMKEMGVNAVRCSHNPPAPEFLDLCDRMGFLVMDEPFDMWRQRKTERDYARFFDKWHERDLEDHIRRDRNHPGIFLWSIGNEVLEQWSNASADTLSLAEANFILNFGQDRSKLAAAGEMSVNSMLAAKLAGIIRKLDPTRPITSGCNEPDPGNHIFRSDALDVIGYNYHDGWFASVPENFPGKPFIVTESVSALMTRGWYRMPSDSVRVCPPLWDDPRKEPSFACSSYDNYHVPWGCTHEKSLGDILHNGFISGQFIWTGFDYIGEPIPFGWPARSSYFGTVDLAGFPKDIYYMYQSVWRQDIDVLHLFPHWNWREGETVDVHVCYNNADCVELFLNGRSLGERRKLSFAEVEAGVTGGRPAEMTEQNGMTAENGDTMPEKNLLNGSTEFHVCWRVPFEPGELKAVAKKDGKPVRETVVRTAGAPASLRLTPDRTVIHSGEREMCFVTVEVLDSEGNLCPLADNLIRFEVEGTASIAGVDNGSPISLERFKSDHRHAMYGKALVILQGEQLRTGKVTLKARADNGEGGELNSAIHLRVK